MYIQSQQTRCGEYVITQYSDEVSSFLLRNAIVVSKGDKLYPPKSIGHWCGREELEELASILVRELEEQVC